MVVLESGSGDAVTDADVVVVVVVVVVGDAVVVVGGDYHPVNPGPVCEASSHSYGFSVHDLYIA